MSTDVNVIAVSESLNSSPYQISLVTMCLAVTVWALQAFTVVRDLLNIKGQGVPSTDHGMGIGEHVSQ